MKNIPNKIYLQFAGKESVTSATWCEDKIDDSDVEYVKSDLYNEMLKVLIEINKLAHIPMLFIPMLFI